MSTHPEQPTVTNVAVLLNLNTRESFMDGYKPTDPLTYAFTFRVGIPAGSPRSVDLILDTVFRLANVGDDPTFGEVSQQAVEYRRLRNRSLSLGDVAVVDGWAYALQPGGWVSVEQRTYDTVGASEEVAP